MTDAEPTDAKPTVTTPADRRRLTSLSRSISGARAIVTGSASGIGRATAHLMADEGARVIVADVDADRVTEVVSEIVDVHGAAATTGVVTDVADHRLLRDLVQVAHDWCGGLDIVVNNAGISLPTSVFGPEEEFEDHWARTLEVNLTAQARLVRLALPFLAQSGTGRVVNVASTEAIVTTAGLAAYAASKAGVVGLTRSLAVELGRHGVTVNCVCPGPILTAMTDPIGEEARTRYARRRVPLRRYGSPEEVAHAIVNLCLPSSSYLNGAVLTVDGGMTVRHT